MLSSPSARPASVADIPESTPLRPICKAAVIGAGTMGGGIAICFLNAGIPTWLLETDQAALDRGVARIRGIYDAQVKKGKLAQAERDKRMALLLPVLKYDAIGVGRHRHRGGVRSAWT